MGNKVFMVASVFEIVTVSEKVRFCRHLFLYTYIMGNKTCLAAIVFSRQLPFGYHILLWPTMIISSL